MSFAYHRFGKPSMYNIPASIAAKSGDPVAEKRLLRACKHVNQYWFPPNHKLLFRIVQGLQEGVYDLDIGFLISELKTDLALLLYTLRETVLHLKQNSIKIPANYSLVSIFEIAGLAVVKKVLLDCNDKISAHDIDAINEDQALRIQETMISASAAEVLSDGANLDSDMSFSCAIIRQLGHILIAWNYQSIYQRCLNSITKNKNLDQLLSEALGFSPQMLALSLLDEWGLEGEIQQVLKPSPTDSAQVQNLAKLCEIGEALARANDPEHYPSAAADWEAVKEDLESKRGFETIKAIQDRVKKNCESYMKLMPEMFDSTQNINPDTHIHDHDESLLLANNQFVKHCPPRLRKKLKNFYAILRPGEIAREALAMLLKEIIPFSGFNGGYVFTHDPVAGYLVPRTQIGRSVKRPMQPVEFGKDQMANDPVATAFNCNSPLVYNGENQETAAIIGSLGNAGKMGVLYLEIEEAALRDPENNPLLHFKAVRQALNDCFQI